MAPRPTIAEIYPSRDGHQRPAARPRSWRFRLRARNGEIIAVGESYTRKSDAIRGAKRVAPEAVVKEVSR